VHGSAAAQTWSAVERIRQDAFRNCKRIEPLSSEPAIQRAEWRLARAQLRNSRPAGEATEYQHHVGLAPVIGQTNEIAIEGAQLKIGGFRTDGQLVAKAQCAFLQMTDIPAERSLRFVHGSLPFQTLISTFALGPCANEMKQLIIRLIIILSLTIGVKAFSQHRFEAPLFIDRDFWQFRIVEHGEYMKTERELNGVYEITYFNGQFKAFKLEANRKTELIIGAGILLGLVRQTTPQHIQFPLFEGKTWTTDYTFRPRRRDVDRSIRAITKVVEFGDVETTLGTIQAFKIERDARFRSADHWKFVYYWSPQTKSVVKYEMNVLKGEAAGNRREIDLIRFRHAP
jgi:hypothetical protein